MQINVSTVYLPPARASPSLLRPISRCWKSSSYIGQITGECRTQTQRHIDTWRGTDMRTHASALSHTKTPAPHRFLQSRRFAPSGLPRRQLHTRHTPSTPVSCTHTRVCVCVCVCVRACVCVCTRVRGCGDERIHACTCACLFLCLCVLVSSNIGSHTCMSADFPRFFLTSWSGPKKLSAATHGHASGTPSAVA